MVWLVPFPRWFLVRDLDILRTVVRRSLVEVWILALGNCLLKASAISSGELIDFKPNEGLRFYRL